MTSRGDIRQNIILWNEFLEQCANLVEGENEWKSVELNDFHTPEQQKNIIDEIYFKRASLEEIVRRHMYNKQKK